MCELALWRRLDTPGHDAARLIREGDGYRLGGCAAFRHESGPACIHYSVVVDSAWRTMRGRVRGFVADRTIDHRICREQDAWYFDGVLAEGLEHLWDLDYGFTPATNLLQLRRAAPAPGEAVDLPVVWFDVDAATLSVLPQRYECCSEATYRYRAPTVPYEGLLETAPNGFAKSYPGLWVMEADSSGRF